MTAGPATPGVRLLGSLRNHRNYRLFALANLVSIPGNWLQSAAQSWLVLELTHSAAAVGAVTFWTFLPYALLGLLGGSLADRWDSRRVMLVSQGGLAVCAAALALLSFVHRATVVEMDAIAVARGVLLVINNPARQALLVRMVGRADLPGAVSFNSAVNNVGRVIGPALAGILIASLGTGMCFMLNSVSYGATIMALHATRPAEFVSAPPRTQVGVVRGIGQGLGYARRHPALRVVAGLLLVVAVVCVNFTVVLPVFVAQTLRAGPATFGMLSSLLGLGAVLGALLAGVVGVARWPVLLAAAAAFGAGEFTLGAATAAPLAAAAILITGAGYAIYTTSTNAIMQLAAPDELQGRMGGLYSYIFTGTNPISALLSGELAQADGAGFAFTVGGVTLAVAASLTTFHIGRRRPSLAPVSASATTTPHTPTP